MWRNKAARRALSLALPVILVLPLLWLSLVAAPSLRIDVGVWGDHTFLGGVNGVERSSSEDYRWTTGRAELSLPNLSSRYQLLRLRAHGWRPAGLPAPLVRLDVAGRPWGSVQMSPALRVYDILLPRDGASPAIRVGFDSPVYAPPGDPRQIGFALDWIEARALGLPSGPLPWHLASQALLLALLALLLRALALPPRWAPALALLLGGALVWANLRQPLWVSQAIVGWLALAALLLLATWLLAPRLRRALAPWMSSHQARLAWALFVAALALRLAGATHPLFDMHDLSVHTRWLGIVDSGQLYLYSTPAEFQNRQTFNPPAGYVLLLPLWLLLPSPRLVVQVGVALIDALGCLLLLPLARELRLMATAGLLALALYLALPINTTMLWWGFATNAMAQSLWLLLLWTLLRLIRRPSPAVAVIFVVLAAACLLTHVGALVLTLATLGLWLLLGWNRLPARGRNAMFGGTLLALLVVTPLYFAVVAGPVLARGSGAGAPALGAALAEGWAERSVRLGLVSRAVQLGLLPPIAALAPLGLALLFLARTRHPSQRVLVAAWLLACLGFLAAYLGLGLVVRYLYFVVPLVCLAVGALLAALWRRHAGRVVTLAFVLLVAWAGATIWVEGVLMRVKPSVVSLTQ